MNRFQSRAPKGKERIEEVLSRDEVGADRGGDGDGGGNGNDDDDDDEGDFAQMVSPFPWRWRKMTDGE